jgi:glycosyltransferase involved in cell wall biosynthesis
VSEICTHDRPLLLERCLRRLQDVDYPDFSVVVVDSAPKSPEPKLLAARYGARYELSPLKGLSRARNVGTRATQADIIAYLDDDMIPHSAWLRSLIKGFSDRDVVAVTGPMLALEFVDSVDADLRSQIELLPSGAASTTPLYAKSRSLGMQYTGSYFATSAKRLKDQVSNCCAFSSTCCGLATISNSASDVQTSGTQRAHLVRSAVCR